jgi:hypothetical protein
VREVPVRGHRVARFVRDVLFTRRGLPVTGQGTTLVATGAASVCPRRARRRREPDACTTTT